MQDPPARSNRCTLLVAWLVVSTMVSCGLLSGPYIARDDAGAVEGVPIELRLEGVSGLSANRIRRVLEDRLFDLSRRPESPAIVQDAVFDVEDFYRQEGFRDATVSARVEPVPDSVDPQTRALIVSVNEGEQITVRDMSVVGAAAYSREELLEFWLQRGSGTLGLGAPLYVENDVIGFAQSLRLFLRGEGYLNATVAIASTKPTETGDQVDIVIEIAEGSAFTVGKVEIDPSILEALGDAAVESPAGEQAHAWRLDEFRTRIRDELRRRGRPEPRVVLDLSQNAETVEVLVKGTPGALAIVAEIIVAGLEDTNDDVIYDLLEFEQGDEFDGAKLDESLRALYLTGLFRRVDVENEWLDTDGDGPRRLRIRINATELDSRTIEALVGWGSYERARAKLRFEEANLLGTGRGLALEGSASLKGWRTLATVSDRNLFNSRIRASLSADAYEREEPSFTDRAYGGTLTFSREIAERTVARVGYSQRLHTGLQNDAAVPAASITDYKTGNPFIEARYDTRDSPIYPRDGLQVVAQCDANSPTFGADIEFVRVRFAASYYVPFSRKLGFAMRTDQGWLWPGEGSDRIPLQERFYNGGENTVRSFKQSELGPKDANGVPIGGEYRNVFGAELRGRLFRTLEGALFADAGNVGSFVRGYGLSDMRYGIGAGLRLALPIGPVRVDAAWNPDRRPDEREWTIHVSVGYPF